MQTFDVQLVTAAFGLIAYARAHEIDLGAAMVQFESALEGAAPGIMKRLDVMCPAPRESVVVVTRQSRLRWKSKLAVNLRRKPRGDAQVNPVKREPVGHHKLNGVVEVRPANA